MGWSCGRAAKAGCQIGVVLPLFEDVGQDAGFRGRGAQGMLGAGFLI